MKSHPKTKQELETEAVAKRDAALAAPLDASNKGFRMLAKLGYQPDTTLGKSQGALKEPVKIEMKTSRGGIGFVSETQKRQREAIERETEQFKRAKLDLDGYREQMSKQREEERARRQVFRAQKVAEHLESDESSNDGQIDKDHNDHVEEQNFSGVDKRCLKSIDVVWRGLIRHQREKERDADLQQLKSRGLPQDNSSEDQSLEEPKSGQKKGEIFVEEDLDEEDSELEEFEALDPKEQLQRVVEYLRHTHRYCFWCMHQYPDEEMDGCPGVTEGDHD